jgi:hypothetical protein
MYNKRSKKNLKMFTSEYQPKKNGRPKGSVSFTTELKKRLEMVDPKSGKEFIKILVNAAIQHAIKGNSAYFKEIVERLDGMITDGIECRETEPVKVFFKYVPAKINNDQKSDIDKDQLGKCEPDEKSQEEGPRLRLHRRQPLDQVKIFPQNADLPDDQDNK